MKKPLILLIIDGWGLAPPGPGNAATLAKTPNFNRLWAGFPHTQLLASGEAVGLPRGENGNSETGHLNLGAGQIVFQDLPRINMSIADGTFYQIPAFKQAANHVRRNKSSLHLLGLMGAGGVHSSLEHLFALLNLAKKEGLNKVWLHLFTDGRDSPPTSAAIYIGKIQEAIKKDGVGKIATIIGRYFAMDRDYHWGRTQKAYDLLTLGKGTATDSLSETIKRSYLEGKTDEFLEPILLDKKGVIADNDGIIFFNFRIDRPRQLTNSLVSPNFETLIIKKTFDPYAEKYGLKQYQIPETTTTFQREKVLKNLFFVTMTQYEKDLPVAVAFPPEPVKLPLSRILAEKNIRQLHLAETEKERFVTYYFNGQREKIFPGEERIEIPSPNVATYDQKPEMSASQLTKNLIEKLRTGSYGFVIMNYANPDMVGHTGVLAAGVKACEAVDQCLGQVMAATVNSGATLVVTADHGNIEEMINLQTGQVDTEHSSNPVPFIVADKNIGRPGQTLSGGILADVTPTILNLMNIGKPESMTGRNLLI